VKTLRPRVGVMRNDAELYDYMEMYELDPMIIYGVTVVLAAPSAEC
jgi:hypothetical protein